ncbi:type II toxin-antitoxin system PemK/MazF family toxin [Marinobacter sp. Arc7-DN-1]|uniref:type II toxin-antitoxin system PemK/MazF family toxin n=1 Tax=Marinobacter sp. Arc7-DN-1 TaxID=2304594 RepID=UPI000E450891|nr:type II toxin-antitoxin system PemK/MazF family toxin [Marinobacter sp. Arc7-DN-1]AXS81921.1 type II toxin-antitoxin system ChpB family toxin [Marinobacter sp. Arc7-DN-1]
MPPKRTFDQGDIIWVTLDPTEGSEIKGNPRPCLVLSRKEFNQLGRALVAPITQGGGYERDKGFAVHLSETKIQGVAVVSQVRTLDLKARNAKFAESAPPQVVAEALARFETITDPDE